MSRTLTIIATLLLPSILAVTLVACCSVEPDGTMRCAGVHFGCGR